MAALRYNVPAMAMNVERFDLASKMDENSWESKFDLAEYAIKQMNTYIADTDIKDEILFTYPVPNNLQSKKDMDSNMKSFLTEMRAKDTISLDKAFNSIQEDIQRVLSALPSLGISRRPKRPGHRTSFTNKRGRFE